MQAHPAQEGDRDSASNSELRVFHYRTEGTLTRVIASFAGVAVLVPIFMFWRMENSAARLAVMSLAAYGLLSLSLGVYYSLRYRMERITVDSDRLSWISRTGKRIDVPWRLCRLSEPIKTWDAVTAGEHAPEKIKYQIITPTKTIAFDSTISDYEGLVRLLSGKGP